MSNHLWQSTIFAVAAGLLTLAFRKNRAQVRYWLWLSASLKFLVPFTLLINLGSHFQWAPAARTAPPMSAGGALVELAQPFPDTVSYAPYTDWAHVAILAAWACGFVAVALIRFRGWLRIRAAVGASTPLEIPAPVEVRSSPGLLEPGVVGLFRPILLLPAGIVERLTPPQLEAVLTHELCHVRRRDNLTSAIHMVVEAVFWFHPLVWWISARLVEERERACDEEVLRLGGEPQVYAEAIVNVCKLYVESPLTCVSGVTGSDIKKRLEAIMTNRIALRLNFAKKAALAAAGIAAVVLPMLVGMIDAPRVLAQSAQSQPLAVNTYIRPSTGAVGTKQGPPGGDGGGIVRFEDGNLVGRNVTARRIMLEAYHLAPYQLSGGPSWLDSNRFDVAAKAVITAASENQLRSALQALLRDTFKLVMRRGTREMPVYALTVARNGPKLREWKQEEPVPTMPRRADAVGYFMDRGNMQRFVDDLSRNPSIDRPVLDKTGLPGAYLFYMAFGPYDTMTTATEDQLGLRLEPQKAPMDILVIDSIDIVERPTEKIVELLAGRRH